MSIAKKVIFSCASLLAVSAWAGSHTELKNVALVRQGAGYVLEAKSADLPVLGYFDELPSSDNPQMASFLAFYDAAVARIEAGADPEEVFLSLEATAGIDSVGPLLGNIRYGQGTPFNNHCPALNGEGRAVTGCVATAMAQVMRYYKHPACGTGVCQYTSSKGASTFDLSTHPFDWTNMLATYGWNYNNAQANAVANLMFACGTSVSMSYSASGSGSDTNKAAKALKTNFYYPFVKCYESVMKDNQDKENILIGDWAWTMRDNMAAGHPVIYAGSEGSSLTGHCFVADGYVIRGGQTYFHINWGWEGMNDGWFLITNFRPDEHEDNYSGYRNTMIVEIYPEGWTSVDNTVSSPAAFDPSLPVYNLLGLRLLPSQLTPGQVYVQQGRKFVF